MKGSWTAPPGTVTGATTFDAIGLQRLYPLHQSENGKLVYTDRRVVSKDGKTLTISRSGTDSQEKAYHSMMVFDKQ